jgi:hypothetical protein
MIAMSTAALLITIGTVAGPATAASAGATGPGASHVALPAVQGHLVALPALKFNRPGAVQHATEIVKLSAAQCRSARDVAPMKKCEIGFGIMMRPAPVLTAATAAATHWETLDEEVTACFGDSANLHGPNNSFSCTAEGYVGFNDEFATNGSWLNLHWVTPIHYASSPGFSFTQTWIGDSGNNTEKMSVGNNWDWGESFIGSGTMQLRVWYEAHCGSAWQVVCTQWAAYWQGV